MRREPYCKTRQFIIYSNKYFRTTEQPKTIPRICLEYFIDLATNLALRISNHSALSNDVPLCLFVSKGISTIRYNTATKPLVIPSFSDSVSKNSLSQPSFPLHLLPLTISRAGSSSRQLQAQTRIALPSVTFPKNLA